MVVVTVAVALVIGGGLVLGQRSTDQPEPGQPVPAATPSEETATLPWVSAMVARNGRDITVYTGPGEAKCKELHQPQASVTEQAPGQVVVAVRGRLIDSVDCSVSGQAVPLVVSLRTPLGDRTLRDAATGLSRPPYLERELPDLGSDERWSPYSSNWMSTDERWLQGYNGPNGSGLLVSAHPTATSSRPTPVATVRIGPHRGVVTGGGGVGRWWTVWWESGEATYSLRLMPAEGSAFTLAQFKRELARLRWR
ncbi:MULTISPECIES: hypothetical protein [unclassified Micromonospora]|uniref:hypothetical protein n=1 Tax=unclassified Micromonospora TaxID=2617518 RepID=UPI0033347882